MGGEIVDIANNVRTSGAYVLYNGLFLFQVGPTKDGKKLGVVRLGGHRENSETAIETAKREVFEEASVNINLINSKATFYLKEWDEVPNKVQVKDNIAPVLIKGSEDSSFTVMYLSNTDTEPKPESETQGLLLLSPKDVHLICNKQLTLTEYQKLNGLSIIKNEINRDLILKPFPQLIFLSKLLTEESELINTYLRN